MFILSLFDVPDQRLQAAESDRTFAEILAPAAVERSSQPSFEQLAQGNAQEFWNLSHTVSEIDDSPNVHMHRLSENSIIGSFFPEKAHPELWLACEENSFHLWVDWQMYLGRGDQYVTYGTDDENLRAEKWSIASDSPDSSGKGHGS